MIDPVSFLVLILLVCLLATGIPGLRDHPAFRMLCATAPGLLLIFIVSREALAFAFLAIAANLLVYALCRIIGNPRVNARFPYLILLLLFIPDVLNTLGSTPVLYLGSAFFIIRQMMTTTQAIKKSVGPGDYLAGLWIASFYFAAIPSGPVFNGLDALRTLRERRPPEYGEGLYRVFEGFVFLFAVGGFMALSVEEVRMLAHAVVGDGNLPVFGLLFIVVLPLVSFGFLFATFYGYSRMAEGAALLLGFTVPQNFNKPHLARDLGDFWKRWHRSMADFVMQYIYLPIMVSTGNAKIALIAAFVFMGLWHDLSLNFLIWGVGHGIGLGYLLPKAKKSGMSALAIRILSLAYVLFLSAIAHRVWFG